MKYMQNATILIVDDTVKNIDLLTAVLESREYKVKTATNGLEALAAMQESIPDLVVLDVMMPEMSGYEVCQAIRQNPKTKLLPVLMLSALDPTLEKVKGLEAGADDFLGKPLNQAELFAKIESLLRIANIHNESRDNLTLLETQAQYDPLTKSLSRTEILLRLSMEIDRSQRNKCSLALMAVDIDYFKKINDHYGHQIGDEVLINLVREIQTTLRSTDSIGRIGGEEFLILLPDTETEGASEIAERIRGDIAKATFEKSPSTPIKITISIGIAIFNPNHHLDTSQDILIKDLVNQADMSMYAAKQNGRNQIAT
jgi:diguanylate cyclase (GGDEF)-like protein